MITYRVIRAIPFVAFAGVFGILWAMLFGLPLILGLLAPLIVAVFIGRDIWRTRKVWNDLHDRAQRSGVDLRDFH